MSVGSWINRKMAMFSLAMGNVEKNAFSQGGDVLSTDSSQEQRYRQGTVADDLKQGKITQEVENLRWRMYKVLQEVDDYVSVQVGRDEDGMPIMETRRKDSSKDLSKVKTEPSDKYPLEMVVDNSVIVSSGNEVMDNSTISLFDKVVINEYVAPKDGEAEADGTVNDTTATHGQISGVDYFASQKNERPLFIERNTISQFEIEGYTEKLHISKIDDTTRLLEFYVSKYPDELKRTTRLFISEVKKAILNPRQSSLLDIDNLNFISSKTLGASDFLEFKYKDLKYDKIVEFQGWYVIKFIGVVEVNGVSILESLRVKDLDEKYKNKEKK